MSQDTIYIAEPLFSEKLLQFDGAVSFPPIKKIGITTGSPQRREKELLGTVSPVKIAIVKAWNGVDARRVESTLHNILDNCRLDGEYFWDGNDTLTEAVSSFMRSYHPDAQEISLSEDLDVRAAASYAEKQSENRLYSEVVPRLESLGVDYKVGPKRMGVSFSIGDYNLRLGVRSGGKYTFTIFSKTKTSEEALLDFKGSQELTAGSTEDSNRRARIPMSDLDSIFESISNFNTG